MLYSTSRASYGEGLPCAWWEAHKQGDKDSQMYGGEYDPHRLLFPHIQALEEDQSDIHLQNVLNAKLYSNRELMAFEWNSQISTCFKPLSANLENLVQSSCDMMHSRLATNRPRAKVMTRGADFGMYRKGRLMDRYLWGEFQHQKVHKIGERTFIFDPMIYGTGFMKVDIDENVDEIFYERTHPDEIIVDQRECVSGEMPMCLAQRKLVSRLWLLQTFGRDKNSAVRKAILECQGTSWKYTSYRSPAEDQIVLIQAWKRPTYKGAGDGRMVLCIENYTLVDREYKRDKFPFVWLKWADPENGFYGRSLVSDIMGYQLNSNDMNDLLKQGLDLACVPRIFIEQGSDVQVHSIDNSVAKFIRYRGTLPECITWPAFNPEMYSERERNRSNCYEYIGLSQALAQSSAPTSQTRFDSSEALQEFTGQQDQRLIRPNMKIEEAYLEVAEHTIELASELYRTKNKSKKAFYMSRNLIQQIDWSEVDMDKDRFVLQIGASSVISMTPAARTDKLERWMNEGKITLEQYYSLSGEPDLERLTDRLAAQGDHFEAQVDKMLRGIPCTPDEFSNNELGFNIVHDELMRLMSLDDGDDEDLKLAIDLHMQWLEIAQELMAPTPDPMSMPADLAMQMAPGAPMAAGPGMTPGSAPPMAMPSVNPLQGGASIPAPGVPAGF